MTAGIAKEMGAVGEMEERTTLYLDDVSFSRKLNLLTAIAKN